MRTALLPAGFPLRRRRFRQVFSRIVRRISMAAALIIAAAVAWAFAAVIFLAAIILLMAQDRENARAERFKDAVRNSKVRLRVSVRIGEALHHPAVSRLLVRLKHVGRVDPSLGEDSWRASLVEGYRKRPRQEGDESEEVVFQIRGGNVWTNGRLCETKQLYHELVMPYEPLRSAERDHLDEDDAHRQALRLRVLVVNGLLKLQVGRFDRSLSPEPDADGRSWQAWETITSFPLLFCGFSYGISPDFLKIPFPLDHSRERGVSQEWLRHTETLRKDLADYNRLFIASDEDAYMELVKRFLVWLEREHFVPLEQWTWPSTKYQNRYLTVSIANCSDEDLALLSDFVEESGVPLDAVAD